MLEHGREPIVCQVVETRGSTPQKAGAMMVIDPQGKRRARSAAEFENEVRQRAIQQIGGTKAAVHSFILDHDYALADGLICGGKMVIVDCQPVSGAGPLGYFQSLDRAIEEANGFTEAVVFDTNEADEAKIGSRFLFDGQCRVQAALPAGRLRIGWRRSGSLGDRPRPSVYDGVAYLPSWARIRLVIVGAGHVGQAVANLAAQADFDVWVVDDRHQYANRDRFPAAQRLLVGPIEETLSALESPPRLYALIVTRGHGHDQEALFHRANAGGVHRADR